MVAMFRLPFGLPRGFPLVPLLNLAMLKTCFSPDIYSRIAFNSGSCVRIDREHLKLRKVRHVDVKPSKIASSAPARRNIEYRTLRSEGRISTPQDSAVAEVNVANENRRRVVNGAHC